MFGASARIEARAWNAPRVSRGADRRKGGETASEWMIVQARAGAVPPRLAGPRWTSLPRTAYAPLRELRDGACARVSDEAELHGLMVRGLAGDSAAHRQLLLLLGERFRVFFRGRMRVGDPSIVEDLVQETLIAIHTRRESYNPNQPLRAWVYAIARYKLIDHFRRTRTTGKSIPVDEVDDLFSSDVADASDPARDVATLLAKLPAKQRLAIQLVKLEELSVKEAAQRTGMTESDIKISIHRGMKKLSALVGKEAQP